MCWAKYDVVLRNIDTMHCLAVTIIKNLDVYTTSITLLSFHSSQCPQYPFAFLFLWSHEFLCSLLLLCLCYWALALLIFLCSTISSKKTKDTNRIWPTKWSSSTTYWTHPSSTLPLMSCTSYINSWRVFNEHIKE